MELRSLVDRAVFLALLGYLVSKIVSAGARLREEVVGTSLKDKIDTEVVFPSVSVCPHSRPDPILLKNATVGNPFPPVDSELLDYIQYVSVGVNR